MHLCAGSVYLKELPASGLQDDALFDVIEKVTTIDN